MKRIAIIDDREVDRFALASLLELCEGVALVGTAWDLPSAVELVEKERPDALLLDVELRTASGFDVLQQLPFAPHVIFVTAHSRYAIRAFEYNALDYLVKPVGLERLNLAIARIPAGAVPEMPVPHGVAKPDEQIFLRDGKRQFFVPINRIAAIAGAGDSTTVSLAGGLTITVRRRMNDWLETLPEDLFLAVDRSLIVNRSKLHAIDRESRSRGWLQLDDGHLRFPIGRAGLERLRKARGDGAL